MTDVATSFDAENFIFDLALDGGDLATEDGLRTAVLISLFTDARASVDDILPAGVTNRRGWWGDLLSEDPTDQIGSKLWLLSREKVTADVIKRAEEYAEDALKWIVDDFIAPSIEVTAFEVLPRVPGRGSVCGLDIKIYRADKPALNYRFDQLWNETANAT